MAGWSPPEAAGGAAEVQLAEVQLAEVQLSEAVLVDLGVAMGPVIASIHDKRDELRQVIRREAMLGREPRIRRVRRKDEIEPAA